MIPFKRSFLTALIVAFMGCASVSQDMRLSDLGFQELSKGNYEQAEKYLNEALEIYRFNPYAILNLGVVYQNTGRLEKAREAYNNVISLQAEGMVTASNEPGAVGKSLVVLARENLAKLQQ